MIDDDEIASPDWLELMVRAAETTGADLVGGPVLPDFDDEGKRGLRRHPAFRPAYDTSGPVPVIYGCGNCLITRPVFARLADPAFDLRFNFLGGGDTDFFVRCRQAGMKFHWAAEAVISETVPESRTSPGWLALRGLRIGAINYHIEVKAARTFWSRARLIAQMLLATALVAVSRRAAGFHGTRTHHCHASDDGRGRQRAGGDRNRTATLQSLEDRLVSQLVATSEVRAVVGELRRQQVMDLVRGATFVGALLLAWISLHPFDDLGNMQIGDVTTGNEVPTYATFGGLAVLTLALADARQHARAGDVAVAGIRAVRRLVVRHRPVVARSRHLDSPLRA